MRASLKVLSFLVKVPSLLSVLLLLSACGGSGGGGSSSVSSRASSAASSSVQPIVYTLNTQTSGSGSISPTTAQVTAGNAQSFSLSPEAGFEVATLSGCSGNINGLVYTTSAINAACTLAVSFVPIDYSLGGNVTGLMGNLTLRLMVGAQEELLPLVSNGSFTFLRSLNIGQGYQVSVASQPATQTCQISNDFGAVSESNIADIAISCIAVNATASVSGKISAVAGTAVDTTVNDKFAHYADNSIPSTPQPIGNRVTLHGFASYKPTGGDEEFERYANGINEDDYYLASLQAGQIIQLQVVDYNGFDVDSLYEGDLDLYLFTPQGDQVTFSNGVTEFEEIVVPTDGDYLINVWAYEGISKYVLRLLPPDADNLQLVAQEDFVPHQMIVQWDKNSAESAAMKAQAAEYMQLSHAGDSRPTLVEMQPQMLSLSSGSQKAKARVSRALEDLRQLNPASYDKVVTLRNIKTMGLQPGVSFAEPNYLRRALRDPNDSGYIHQWHYNAINLPLAWDISVGNRPAGQEVLVAVVDTGIYLQHPDLAGQLVGGYDFIANSQSARDGDGIDVNADDPGDSAQRGQSSWHGTHVAGTIAAASDNNIGVVGVSWGARIMPIRVLGENGGTSYDIIQGLRYAARLSNDSGTLPSRRADIANLSLGGGGGSLAEQNAYAAVRAAGVIIVAAAGNENSGSPSYPAAYDGVISVSATDYLNQRAPYSNFGGSIDLAAPGGDVSVDLNGDGYADGVLSATADDTSGSREPNYRFYNGTSMAAPHVAGVLALMKAVHPGLTPAQVDALIQSGALSDDLGTTGRDNTYGYGLINALKAVRVASDLAAGTPLPEWPAQMRAQPGSLNIGLSSNASITVSNQGGGSPQVSSVSDNQPWMDVSAGVVTTAGLGSYQVNVNRAGLEPGLYQGQVTFTFTGADPLTVTVNMQVGASLAVSQLTQMYVLLIDPETQDVLDQAIPVRTGNELLYTFLEVPAGEFLVIAGSDIDADGFICQSAESCGAYPSLALRQPVSVQGIDLSGLDFVADILGNFSAAEASALFGQRSEKGVRRQPRPKVEGKQVINSGLVAE